MGTWPEVITQCPGPSFASPESRNGASHKQFEQTLHWAGFEMAEGKRLADAQADGEATTRPGGSCSAVLLTVGET